MGRVLHHIATIYLMLGILALLLIPASLFEWFGMESDPLSGVFAYLLSLPWVLILNLFESGSTWLAMAVSAVGIGINFMLLRWLSRRLLA